MELQSVEVKSLAGRGYQSPLLIGRGAHGMVYRVREAATGKFYACKVGREEGLWKWEKMLLAKVGHPLFPYYVQDWQEKGKNFLVMEYASGGTLAQILGRRGHLTQRQAVRVALFLAEGLAYLEALPNPILFRDLKPENVKIQEDGRVKLLDLGCSCPVLQECHTVAGTPGYAAPEQLAADGKAGTYSDVYAFGRLLHYMLTGDNPCLPPRKKPPIGAYGKRFSSELERLVEECVQEAVEERLPDMRCVLRRLQGFLSFRTFHGKKQRIEFVYEKNVFKTNG